MQGSAGYSERVWPTLGGISLLLSSIGSSSEIVKMINFPIKMDKGFAQNDLLRDKDGRKSVEKGHAGFVEEYIKCSDS